MVLGVVVFFVLLILKTVLCDFFVEYILNEQPITIDTNAKAVNQMRVDIATTLRQDTGIFVLWLIIFLILTYY